MDLDKYYIGIVEDNIDLKRLGRVKIRVFGVFDEISVDLLPWASPQLICDGTSFNIPAVGKLVNVYFDRGCIYCPYYTYSEKYNINLQDRLSNLADDEYKAFKALLFDHKTQLYADNEGLTMDHLLNKIKITNDSINIELKNNENKLFLGSASASQSAVLGDHFIMDFLKEFFTILLRPDSLTGNLAAPILKPDLDAHIRTFLSNPEKYISRNVFIVDNNSVELLERKTKTSEVEHDDTKIISPSDSGVKTVENSNEVSESAKTDIKTDQQQQKEKLQKGNSKEITPNDKDYNSNSNGDNSGTVFGERGRTDTLNSDTAKDNKGDSSSIKDDPTYGTYKI